MKDAAPTAGRTPLPAALLAALAGSILLASLGISIATVALPTLARAFSADIRQVQWVVLAYLLAVTVAIVCAGRLGDLYGHRRILAVGLAWFALASAACAWAPGMDWLIAARVAQGLGGAILMALPMSIAKGLVAQERMGAAMGLLGTMSAIGTALGPSLGGVLIGALGWQSAFGALAVCGAGMLALVLYAVPKAQVQARPAATGRMDWAGSFWLSVTLLCLTLCATGAQGGLAIAPWMLLVLGAAAGAMFVRTERAAHSPLVPLALLRAPTLSISLAMNLLVGAAMMATLVVGPFFLSFGLGLSAAATGMVMAMGPVAAALSGVPAGRLADRFGTPRTLLAGLALATVGLLSFAVLPTLLQVPGYVAALVLMTPGFQLFLAANNTAVMRDAAPAHRGMVAGLLGLSRNLGFMAGALLMPLLFATLLGGQGVAGSTAAAIGAAFRTTFVVAAGLGGLAMLLARRGSAQAPAA